MTSGNSSSLSVEAFNTTVDFLFPGNYPSFAVGTSDSDLYLRGAIGAALVILLVLPCGVLVVGSRFYTSRIPVRVALVAHPAWLTQKLLHTCHLPPWPLRP